MIGEKTESGDTEFFPMKYQIRHPDYNAATFDYDFGIIVFSLPSTVSQMYFHSNVTFVTLNSNDEVPSVGETVTSMGWGRTIFTDPNSYSDVLKDVSLHALSNKKCKEITDSMLCAGAKNEGTCEGDRGSPLVIKGVDSSGRDDVQVGVTISPMCANLPDKYARISKVYDWIAEMVCSRSSDAPASFKCKDPPNEMITCKKGQTKLTVEVKTDLFPIENSYEVKNPAGHIVIHNHEFFSNDINTVSYCIKGCDGYLFTMMDSYGDGMTCSIYIYTEGICVGENGYYNITINDDTANTYTGGTSYFYEDTVRLSMNNGACIVVPPPDVPSESPSMSNAPSKSNVPSENPSMSIAPSKSYVPSENPTMSDAPSKNPSNAPTKAPTAKPTAAPTPSKQSKAHKTLKAL